MSEQMFNPLEVLSKGWEHFFQQFPPEKLILQFCRVETVQQSISTNRMALQHIQSYMGKYEHKKYGLCDSGILYVYEWLDYLNSISNINKPLPAKNIQQLSYILYAKYHYFYLSDLKIILERILEGKYGKFYGSVDAQLIMTAFKEYDQERKKLIEELKYKETINGN